LLNYDDEQVGVSLGADNVAQATVTLAQAALINVATETSLDLGEDSFTVFTDQIKRVIDDPKISMTPADLLRHAEAYAARGAQAVVAEGDNRFHEGTWFSQGVCPLWPFC